MRIRFTVVVAATFFASSAIAQALHDTAPHVPPMAVGNEANAEQLRHARIQGDAYAQAIAWERAGAAWSAQVHAGDLLLSAATSAAEGGWDLTPDGLRWTDPAPGRLHLRVFAQDAADGRVVPGATVHAGFVDASGRVVGTAELPAGIYPLTDAYGADVTVPAQATTLVVTVDPLPWRRHDPYNGDRYSTPTVAVFENLPSTIPTGTPASARAEQAPAPLRRALDGALDDTVDAMWRQANAGAEQRAGDFRIDYAVEFSEAYWSFHDGRFRYSIENENSTARNAHVEVAPRDAANGNFLAGLRVVAELIGPDGPVPPPHDEPDPGAPAEPGQVPFMWHSWLFHYGENWRVPRGGTYRLRIHVDAPTARRYGRASGNRLGRPVDVTFDGVTIKAGTK